MQAIAIDDVTRLSFWDIAEGKSALRLGARQRTFKADLEGLKLWIARGFIAIDDYSSDQSDLRSLFRLYCRMMCQSVVEVCHRDLMIRIEANVCPSPRCMAILRTLASACGPEARCGAFDLETPEASPQRLYLGPVTEGEGKSFTRDFVWGVASTVAGLLEMEACLECWESDETP